MKLALSPDGETRKEALEGGTEGQHLWLAERLDRLFAGAIIMGSMISALIVPIGATSKRTVDLLTTMVFGFCAANLVIGFNYMRWSKFAVWLAAGLICAVAVVAVRTMFVNKPSKLRSDSAPTLFG